MAKGGYKGQVAGAFYKEGLGDIDLVWGKVSGKGKQAQGFGLAKILEKHLDDFKDFAGDTKEQKLINGLMEIMKNGKVVTDDNGRTTIVYRDYFKIGLKGNWKGEDTKNKWIITAYEDIQQKERDKIIHSDSFTKGETLPLNSKDNSSTNSIKLQANSHIGTGNTKKDFDLSNKDDMQELKVFFHTHSTDTQEAKELFNRVLEQAQHFKIKVNFTNDLPRGASGEYDKYYLVKILDDYHPEYKAQTLFHELIHSVTTNAIMLVNVRAHLDKTTLLHPKQIEAVNTITTIYKDIKTKFPKFSAVSRNYGMKNEFEFIAELANPEFRDKLKKLNVFEKIVDAITKIVVYLKDSVRGYGKPTGNAYEKTKKALIDIIDNYDKDFLEKYINTYKKEGMSSQAHYNLKLESKFLNNDKGEIDFRALESEAVKLPKALKFSAFKKQFNITGNTAEVKTPIGNVSVNIWRTYKHLFENTHSEDRGYISGAFLHTLTDPLFVVKQEYTMRPPFSKKDAYLKVGGSPNTAKNAKSPAGNLNKDIIQDSYVFYKPFKDKNGLYHLASFAIDKNGELLHKTFYELDRQSKLERLIKSDDENIVYVKPTLTLPNHNTIAEFSRPSTAMDSASTTSGKKQDLQNNSTIDSKLLSKQGIDEVSLVKVQSKFNYDEKKASDLLEWHKDSSPITKDKDGLPKVFYHGSGGKFEVFEGGNDELGRAGMYFSSSKKVAETYKIWDEDEVYSVFLNIKNPLIIDAQGNNYNSKFFMAKLREVRESGAIHNHDGVIFKNIRDEMAQGNGELADTIVVFDSNQIKHIDNKGSYTDSSGNITSTKPKDTQAEHRYFNEASPNIYQSNPHIGSGLVSGTLAGVETDEQGNIIGFDPSKFALGFLGGAVGSKGIATIYKHKSAQEYALKSIRSIQENYKELSQQNPVLFAKILSNINPRNFLKSKKEVKALSEEVFNKELKAKIQESIAKQEVEPMPQSAFKNLDEFENLFDEIRANKGIIKTPYKDVEVNVKYAFRHFTKNTYNTDRNNIKGGFFATFKNPLFVVEQTREGSHKPSVYFYKPFYDENKKLLNLFGISVDNKGKLDFKTYYLDSAGNRLKSILNDKDLVIRYVKE